MRRKILMGFLALAVPAGTLLVAQSAASAKSVTGTGLTTCTFSGTISFDPPLTKSGSTTIKKETTTVSATLGHCTSGTPVGVPTSTSVKPIKTKTAKGAKGGTCNSFDANSQTALVKVTAKWSGEKPSKFTISGLHAAVNNEAELGFTGSFPVSGSYAGTGHVGVYLTPASSNAIGTCSGSVSVLHIDGSTSSGTI